MHLRDADAAGRQDLGFVVLCDDFLRVELLAMAAGCLNESHVHLAVEVHTGPMVVTDEAAAQLLLRTDAALEALGDDSVNDLAQILEAFGPLAVRAQI